MCSFVLYDQRATLVIVAILLYVNKTVLGSETKTQVFRTSLRSQWQ